MNVKVKPVLLRPLRIRNLNPHLSIEFKKRYHPQAFSSLNHRQIRIVP